MDCASVAGRDLLVAVIDDRPLVRQGLLRVLQRAPGIGVARCLPDVPEADDAMRYDVLMIGIHSLDSVQMLQRIHHVVGRCPLLLVSDSLVLSAVMVLLNAGADGYLTIDADEHALCEAVHRVASGKPYLAAAIVELIGGAHAEPTPHLAPREADVLRHIAAGHTHAQTAGRMGVSVATVETYLQRIRKKFAIDTPTHLVRLAHRAYVRHLLEQHGA
ncbi:DNA-binding NarL/FixJ family response regulator [Saccharothrix tamanrassetensis]|uniref:DNA-binding NarL/FixJ family response regulator n=1 Tax=Saccharothrix tamanrassetensis TaxID=1051531 RepID=A0A841CRV3_9PSEU|nr:response regulator transcription factor [Saccharothrix tamanrassetensis]MBB5959603.1 DNA-binding NarL/FixJ family response regulator [Saccharothrix tamanrassetensis]